MTDKKLSKLKTSAFERRMALARASMTVGTRWAGNAAGGLFKSKVERDERNHEFLVEQAQYLVAEISSLKGSLVKIGQMAALYGDHFFPREVAQALHALDDQTTPVDFAELVPFIQKEMGPKFAEFNIEPKPVGNASLAQVHRATHIDSGDQVVLKIQYPGVAEAVDSDLNTFRSLLKLTNLLPQTRAFDEWFEELRSMMHREVNYLTEADSTRRFAGYLHGDDRYAVPKVWTNYTTDKLLVMSYEHGVSINTAEFDQLDQSRKDRLGEALVELTLNEIFTWGEMQTDPNFGNYLIRLGDQHTPDKIVLLDFGAIRAFDDHLLEVAQNLMKAGYSRSYEDMLHAMQGYEFFDTMPEQVKSDLAEVFLLATEPFSKRLGYALLPSFATAGESYNWKQSKLHARVIARSKSAVATRYFSVPPKEFMFISRKFLGVYSFMSVLGAHSTAYQWFEQHA